MSYQMINSLPLKIKEVEKLCEYNIEQIKGIGSDFETYKKYLGASHYNANGDIALSALCAVNPDVQYTDFYSESRRETIRTLKDRMKQGKIIVEGDNCIMVSNPIEMLKCACGEKLVDREPAKEYYYKVFTPLFEDGAELAGFRSPHIAAGNVCIFKNCKNNDYDTYLNLTSNIVVMDAYKSDVMQRLQGADTDSDFVLLTNNEIVVNAAKECMKRFLTPINQIKGKPKAPPAYSMETLSDKDKTMANHLIGDICNLGQIYNSYYWHEYFGECNEEKLNQIYNCISRLSSLSQIAIDRAKKTFAIDPRKEWDKLSKNKIIQRRRVFREEAELRRKTEEETDELIKKVKEIQGKLSQAEKKAETIKEKEAKTRDEAQKAKYRKERFELLKHARDEYKTAKFELLKVKKKKQVKPLFMEENSKDRSCIFEHFNTPMDFVFDVVNGFYNYDNDKEKPVLHRIPNAKKREKKLEFWDLLITKPNQKAQSELKRDVVESANSLRKHQLMYWAKKKDAYENNNTEDYEKYKEYANEAFKETVDYIRRKKMSQATMYNLICRSYGKPTGALKKDETLVDKDTKKVLLNLLAAAQPKLFYSCFERKSESEFT